MTDKIPTIIIPEQNDFIYCLTMPSGVSLSTATDLHVYISTTPNRTIEAGYTINGQKIKIPFRDLNRGEYNLWVTFKSSGQRVSYNYKAAFKIVPFNNQYINWTDYKEGSDLAVSAGACILVSFSSQDFATLWNTMEQLEDLKEECEDAAQEAHEAAEYAKQKGDYAKEMGDNIVEHHTQYVIDHNTAVSDHTQAQADHTTISNISTQIETKKVIIRNTKSVSSVVGEIYGGASDQIHIKPADGKSIKVEGAMDVTNNMKVYGKINSEGGLSIVGTSSFSGKVNAYEVSSPSISAGRVSVTGDVSIEGGIHALEESTFNGKILAKSGLSVSDGELRVNNKTSLYGGATINGDVEINSEGHSNAFVVDAAKIKARMADWLSAAVEYTKKRINLVSPEIRWVQKVLQEDGTYTDKEYLLSEELGAIPNKVDKVSGKNLSTNDYTDADKAEVAKVANKADKTEIPTTLPASDVSAWAKESTKPSYTANEVGAIAKPSTEGSAGQVLTIDTNGNAVWKEASGGGEEAKSYDYYMSILNTESNGQY